MRHQLYLAIVAVISDVAKRHRRPGRLPTYSDARILEVYFFAVIYELPICHACDRSNWPISLRRQPLPDGSRMSRRLKSPSVQALLDDVEREVRAAEQVEGCVAMVDSKVLPIGPNSHDRDAKFGYSSGVKANGYRLHALLGADGTLIDWRLTPMNTDERLMARRMLTQAKCHGYVVGDGNFDDNKLHAVCDARSPEDGELQLVAPKRRGKGFGHRRQRPGRLRSFELLHSPEPTFAAALLKARVAIERFFGALTSSSAGLNHLPPWVRTYRRVSRYVKAALTLFHLRVKTTYVG